ncbi:MAG: rod shape-determining protein RodA [Holosporales bacterium]|jgi:rod shape determining protein RodA|nr:rod shape-determining protein RodA [Holosporales bacterium]
MGFYKKIISNTRFFRIRQLSDIPKAFFVILLAIMAVSLILLYSAGGGFSQWCEKQLIRFIVGFLAMFTLAVIPIRFWYTFSYILYAVSLLCLLATSLIGVIGLGAQRWLNLGFFQIQPSEFMRIALIISLARYLSDNPNLCLKKLIIPTVLVALPTALTIMQPDLGTAMLLLIGSGGLFFLAGVSIKFFLSLLSLFCSSLPFLWFFLHDYQKNRILMFLDPQRDPLGAGYHIIQSKIAIGSGGFWGKGFLQGTQSTLNFLPEKQTDFIFTLLSEEFGFLGIIFLIVLYCSLILLNISFFYQTKNLFNRLVIAGFTLSFTLYVTINIAMVVGFLPVVGIPLPLVSYGGTSLVTIMASFGMILSATFQRTKASFE